MTRTGGVDLVRALQKLDDGKDARFVLIPVDSSPRRNPIISRVFSPKSTPSLPCCGWLLQQASQVTPDPDGLVVVIQGCSRCGAVEMKVTVPSRLATLSWGRAETPSR